MAEPRISEPKLGFVLPDLYSWKTPVPLKTSPEYPMNLPSVYSGLVALIGVLKVEICLLK
jgi:hypothetical protein